MIDRSGMTTMTAVGDELYLLMQSKVLLQVTVFAAQGIVTSHFLKLLSSVTKEIATAMEMIGSIPLDALIFGAPFGLTETLAGFFVLSGVLTFASKEMTQGEADKIVETIGPKGN